MKKLLLTLIMSIFLLSFCSAVISDLGTFKQYQNITLPQICDSCTWNNITVLAPNSSTLVFNQPMTSNGANQFSYLLSGNHTSSIGVYKVQGIGNDANPSWTYIFEVTPNGELFTQGKAIFYLVITLIILGMAILFFALGHSIELGGAKTFFYFMAGVMFIFLMAIGINMASENFVTLEVSNTISYLWYLTITLCAGGIVIGIIIAVIAAMNAMQIKRGLKD
jgi:hypothetical protein